jgi:hypothetical protein
MPYARMWGLRGLRTTTTVAPLIPFPKRAGHAPPSPPTPHPFLRPPPSPPTQIISEVLRRHRHPAHTFLLAISDGILAISDGILAMFEGICHVLWYTCHI